MRPQHVVSGVVRLLFWCGPPAVFRGIWAVVILSIQCLADRAVAHIRKKISKIKPSVTNGNAAPTPSFVVLGVGI